MFKIRISDIHIFSILMCSSTFAIYLAAGITNDNVSIPAGTSRVLLAGVPPVYGVPMGAENQFLSWKKIVN